MVKKQVNIGSLHFYFNQKIKLNAEKTLNFFDRLCFQ
ncbi:hypothetical protein PRO82_002014 [Candidatus Protochlamydia amoebophila]|nr:hypothetical protein [Candidatus Protochlamydia amoebophila]